MSKILRLDKLAKAVGMDPDDLVKRLQGDELALPEDLIADLRRALECDDRDKHQAFCAAIPFFVEGDD